VVVPEPEVDWELATDARPEARARNARLLIEEDMTNRVICCILKGMSCQKQALWIESRQGRADSEIFCCIYKLYTPATVKD
jgi:hypothetical protein